MLAARFALAASIAIAFCSSVTAQKVQTHTPHRAVTDCPCAARTPRFTRASIAAEPYGKLPHPDNPDTIYKIDVPNTGKLRVKVDQTHWTVKLALQFEEFPDVKWVQGGQEQTFALTRAQSVYFQMVNDPDNQNAYYTNAFSPNAAFSDQTQGLQTDTWDYSVARAGGGIVNFEYRYVPLRLGPSGQPLVICTGGQGSYTGPFERGFCATEYCPRSHPTAGAPESWVRGRADLDPANGQVAMLLELETDSVLAGPKGVMTVKFLDSNGNTLATAHTAEVGVGGKSPGEARIVNVPASGNIPPNLASKVTSITVNAACTDYVDSIFNLIPGDLKVSVSWQF